MYWFFFSYAHADDNQYLRNFYKNLEDEVRQLTGAQPREISFLDRDTIAHGATWDAALEQGLKDCRVFVPLYSASYFRAIYCGKEFAVFRERLHEHQRQRGLAIDDALILPVLWSPEQNVLGELPAAINKIQYKHGSYPTEYTTEGVSQMVKLGVAANSKYYNEYWDFVRKFANTIVETAKNLVLSPHASSLTPLDKVTGLFSPTTQASAPSAGQTGPRNVQFIFVAGNEPELRAAQRSDLKSYGPQGGSDWLPYLDTYKGNAAELAIEAIESFSKDSHYEGVNISAGIEQQIRLAASQDKIVVVMVDTWTLRLPNYNQLVAPIDQYSPVNCITLIVWNEEDREAAVFKGALVAAVNGAFTTKVVQNPPNFLSLTIKSYDTFKEELSKALSRAQAQIIDIARIKKDLEFALVKTPNAEFGTKPSF